jgi:hypothetical protein
MLPAVAVQLALPELKKPSQYEQRAAAQRDRALRGDMLGFGGATTHRRLLISS